MVLFIINRIEVDLSAYTNTPAFIRFRKDAATTSYWKVDDVEVYCGTCVEPTTNSTDLTFINITNSTLDANIGVIGNGFNSIIVAKQGSAVDFTPVDGTTYTVNSDYSAGTDL